MQSASKRSEVACAAQSSSHFPVQPKDRIAGQVGEVGHGAVGVAPRVGRLAAAVGLDPLADLALGVRDAARLLVLLHRHVAVRHLPVRDPVRAHDAREADVDHASLRLHVQAHPEPGEENRGAGEHPDRPDRRPGARRPVAAGDPDAAAEQVDERRIRERSAPEDLALVEEPERDREGQQREEVEVAQREKPAQIREPDQEERRRTPATATCR